MDVESEIRSKQLYALCVSSHLSTLFLPNSAFKLFAQFSDPGSCLLNYKRETKAQHIDTKTSHLGCISGIRPHCDTSLYSIPQSVHHKTARMIFVKWKSEHVICSKLCKDSSFHSVNTQSSPWCSIRPYMIWPCLFLKPLLSVPLFPYLVGFYYLGLPAALHMQ